MDEERFESLLLDELYGELDEETSASMKRYAAAHPRAAEKLSSFYAVRRAAAPVSLAVPDSLEARILDAVRDTNVVVPFRQRASSVVSRAGAWAMRPQTAMAAVFLLMVGSSVLLVRGSREKAPSSSSVTVIEQGAPAVMASANEDHDSPDLQSAALAHGTQELAKAAPATTPSGAMGSEGALAAGDGYRVGDSKKDVALDDSRRTYDNNGGRGWAPAPPSAPMARAAPSKASAPMAKGAAASDAVPQGTVELGLLRGTVSGARPDDLEAASAGGSVPAATAATRTRGSSDFEAGMAAYTAKRFDYATAAFDRVAAGGDMNAALWGARSVRDGSGCAAALRRFDDVANAAFPTVAGQEATLEGGRCYKATGATDAARSRFQRLLTVPAYMGRAQKELDALAARPQAKAASTAGAPTKPVAPPTTTKGDATKQNDAY